MKKKLKIVKFEHILRTRFRKTCVLFKRNQFAQMCLLRRIAADTRQKCIFYIVKRSQCWVVVFTYLVFKTA